MKYRALVGRRAGGGHGIRPSSRYSSLGLNRGIEFNGGVRDGGQAGQSRPRLLRSEQPFTGAGVQEPVVQTAGGDIFVITAAAMTDQQFAEAEQTLTTKFAASPSGVGLERIGPSFGQETAQRALIAILVSIIVMIGYLSLAVRV